MAIFKETLTVEDINELKQLAHKTNRIQSGCLTFILCLAIITFILFNKNIILKDHLFPILMFLVFSFLIGILISIYFLNLSEDIKCNQKYVGTTKVTKKEKYIDPEDDQITYSIYFDDWKIVPIQLNETEWNLIEINQNFDIEFALYSTYFLKIDSFDRNYKPLILNNINRTSS